MVQSNTTLNYSYLPRQRWPIHRWYQLAVFCGVAPLITGVAVLLLYLIIHYGPLQMAGFYVIVGGFGLFLLGLIFLLIYHEKFRAVTDESLLSRMRRPAVALLLLLINFPVAGACIYLGDSWQVVVVNRSSVTIDSMIITHSNGKVKTLGPISPGGRRIIFFRPQSEMSITFSASTANGTTAGAVDEYPEHGNRKTITAQPTGAYTVR